MMKATFLAILIIFQLGLFADLPKTHPLRHLNLKILHQPAGLRNEGSIYLHEVAAYVLGSIDELNAARAILEREGYGPDGRHYLYCGEKGKPAVVDGIPFKTREDAIVYLKEQKIAVAFYFSTESSFPASIPGELTYGGTAFQVLDRFK